MNFKRDVAPQCSTCVSCFGTFLCEATQLFLSNNSTRLLIRLYGMNLVCIAQTLKTSTFTSFQERVVHCKQCLNLYVSSEEESPRTNTTLQPTCRVELFDTRSFHGKDRSRVSWRRQMHGRMAHMMEGNAHNSR